MSLEILPITVAQMWSIAVFGFAAALLETLPFIGLIFSISNQIGAAMWAHGMSKFCISEN